MSYPIFIKDATILLAESATVPADQVWLGCNIRLGPASVLTVDGRLEYCYIESPDDKSYVYVSESGSATDNTFHGFEET